MIIKLLIVIALFVFYMIDYSLARSFSKKDYKAFRQSESNKSLVWYVEQFTLTKNPQFLRVFHFFSLISYVFAIVLCGLMGKWVFGLNFQVGAGIFILAQIVVHVFGILSNLCVLLRLRLKKRTKKIKKKGRSKK